MFNGICRDLVYAARSLSKARAFTLVCVVSLGIGPTRFARGAPRPSSESSREALDLDRIAGATANARAVDIIDGCVTFSV